MHTSDKELWRASPRSASAWARHSMPQSMDRGKVTAGDFLGSREVAQEQLPLPHGGCHRRHLRQFAG
jgi:hypothetical protein